MVWVCDCYGVSVCHSLRIQHHVSNMFFQHVFHCMSYACRLLGYDAVSFEVNDRPVYEDFLGGIGFVAAVGPLRLKKVGVRDHGK